MNIQAPAMPLQPTFLVHKKDDQNALKGFLWLETGAALAVLPPSLMAATIMFGTISVGTASLSSRMTTLMAESCLIAGLASFVVLKGVSACFHNAIYHYGPKYEIVG